MELKEYCEKAAVTAVYQSFDYPFVLLAEEAGEVLGKLNKFARKNKMCLDDAIELASSHDPQYAELRESVLLELGDVAWGLVECCRVMDIDAGEVLQANINKLYGRAQRGTINGQGDNR